jgi:hypothetical protein
MRRYDPRRAPVLPNCDASPSKSLWLDSGWASMPPLDEALYDLVFDPNETRNLVGDPASLEVLNGMRSLLKKRMEESSDPLLSGDLPLPPTALLNSRDGLDPDPEDSILPLGTR